MSGQIFNLYQANKFITYKATVEKVAISRGKTYVQFKVDDLFRELLEKWNNHTLGK